MFVTEAKDGSQLYIGVDSTAKSGGVFTNSSVQPLLPSICMRCECGEDMLYLRVTIRCALCSTIRNYHADGLNTNFTGPDDPLHPRACGLTASCSVASLQCDPTGDAKLGEHDDTCGHEIVRNAPASA